MTLTGRVARLVRLAAVLGLALGGLGLAGPAASASTGWGWLRLAHLSPNTPAVDVYLYSFGNPQAKIVLHHVGYGTVSAYEHVPAGEYTVAMRGAGAAAASKPVLSTTVDVVNGKAYTVAGVGPAAGLRLEVFTDRLKAPRHKALVRVIQASMHQDTVKISLGKTVLAGKLGFPAATSYTAVAPGTLTVRVTGPTQHTTAEVTLSADSIYTLVVLDDGNQIRVASLEDSAGSKVMPDGGAAMGFGGTAPRPGEPLLPWVAAACVGLIALAGGMTVLSRRRRPALHAR
jgi:hypothetical protein